MILLLQDGINILICKGAIKITIQQKIDMACDAAGMFRKVGDFCG